jgi:hypothetical protein
MLLNFGAAALNLRDDAALMAIGAKPVPWCACGRKRSASTRIVKLPT